MSVKERWHRPHIQAVGLSIGEFHWVMTEDTSWIRKHLPGPWKD